VKHFGLTFLAFLPTGEPGQREVLQADHMQPIHADRVAIQFGDDHDSRGDKK